MDAQVTNGFIKVTADDIKKKSQQILMVIENWDTFYFSFNIIYTLMGILCVLEKDMSSIDGCVY